MISKNTQKEEKNLIIRQIQRNETKLAQNIIMKGLKERWGALDMSKNPDLNNIYVFYYTNRQIFVVAIYQSKMIGTGAIIKESVNTARIVRMYVMKEYRRQKIAHRILIFLENFAISEGYNQIVLETCHNWISAMNFYQKENYHIIFKDSENAHFMKELL
ncbi:MAG: GNAT family N-acetyltransferase [Candidatus Lokiarchaeota archaeon]|nr:GNAT family N-acetyltransferase [Candidatus Harpocratesius repetitus]